MEGIRADSATARLLAAALGDDVFTLVDVGCSGGIDAGWSVFGDRLRAFGFDASLQEIARLAAQEPRPGVEYLAARVGLPPGHGLEHAIPDFNWWRRNPWERLAVDRRARTRPGAVPELAADLAARWSWPEVDPLRALPPSLPPGEPSPLLAAGADVLGSGALDPDEHRRLMASNRWRETALAGADGLVHLPSFLTARGTADLDFVKIDVDGPDYGILVSLSDWLTRGPVIAASLEVNFFGTDAPHHHTFHNTDRFMRAHGFDLFGLTVRPYASAALPSRFTTSPPTASASGRPLQGDAFYARDTAWKGGGELELSVPKLVKLAAVFGLFGVFDQAAEVLLRHRDGLADRLDVDATLDALTQEAWPDSGLRHAELIARFDAGHPMFDARV